MSCMEHWCSNANCDYYEFNNLSSKKECPKCGATVLSCFDEEPDLEEQWINLTSE